MDFRILGPLEVRRGGSVVAVGGRKRRALLALLLLHANETVSKDRLIDALWGEWTPATASSALYNHLSGLRKLLGPEVVVKEPGGYLLRVEPGELDLERFEELVAEAGPLPPAERAAKLREALELWRGQPLADLAYEPFAGPEITHLEGMRMAALENRIEAELELGRHCDLVPELEQLAVDHPLEERLRGLLILALYRSGRQGDALEAYRDIRRALDEELGLEPTPALRELESAILRQDPALAAPEAPAPAHRSRRKRVVVLAFAVLAVLALAGLGAALATRGSTPRATSAASQNAAVTGTQAAAVQDGVVAHGPASASRSNATPRTKAKARAKARARARASGATRRRATRGGSGHAGAAVVAAPAVTRHPPAASSGSGSKGKKQQPAVTPEHVFLLEDDFGDGSIDGKMWHSSSNGNGVTIDQTNGQVEIELKADADPGDAKAMAAAYGTECHFPADFDARVDFALIDWPAGSGVLVSLNAFLAGAGVGRESRPKSDDYTSWVATNPDRSPLAPIPTGDLTGSLRIVRRGADLTTYIRKKGKWVTVGQGRSRRSAVIGLQAQVAAEDWRHDHVRVAFDNFVATAQQVDCPVGSLPPRT